MPTLITRQQVAASTAERFKQQYGPDFLVRSFGDTKQIYAKLVSLGNHPSCEDVEKVMPSWTHLRCDECEKEVDAVVQFGEDLDWESATANICKECLAKGATLMAQMP